MAEKKVRKTVILSKLETVYDTDSVPTGAANAIQISNATLRGLEADEQQRGLLKPTLGADPTIKTNVRQGIDFTIDLAGAGAAGDVPAWGVLWRGMGFAETVSAGVDVTYTPVSAGFESLSHYAFMDGIRHVLTGSRGTGRLELAAGAIPHMMPNFTGSWAAPTDVANPTVDFSAFVDPVEPSKDNTPTVTLHGFACVLRSFSLDIGNAINHKNYPGARRTAIGDRAMVGQISIEAPAVATKDFFSIAKSSALGALQIIHGTVAGNIIQIDAPKVELMQPSYEDDQGDVFLNMGLRLIPDSGDDELTLTVK